MNKMYLVIHTDTHFGAKYELYTNRENAIKRAEEKVTEIIKKRPFLADEIEDYAEGSYVFSVQLGEEYDRNVSVLELDANP